MFKTITIDISVEELETLMRKAIQAEYPGMIATDVTFKVESRSVGYGVNECDVKTFTGATVKVSPQRSVG
jgi:hypothetical protein